MIKTTLKAIKAAAAIDVTNASTEELKVICPYLETIAYSTGVYGVTGKIFKHSKTNQLYKITKRNSNFFYLGSR